MQHLEPDRLVLLALAEESADAQEAVHLAVCEGCRAEIDALRHVAELGAETQGLRSLPPPPDRVWAGIVAQTGPSADPVRPRARASRRRWVTPALAAVAAAVLAIAGTVAVQTRIERQAGDQVTAKVTLTRLGPAPADAHGFAEVLAGNRLRLDVADLPLTTGYYEVWLINPDDPGKMMALGNLTGAGEVTLPLPPGADLNRYRLVDVSAEAFDGDAAHSGESLLRGTLTN